MHLISINVFSFYLSKLNERYIISDFCSTRASLPEQTHLVASHKDCTQGLLLDMHKFYCQSTESERKVILRWGIQVSWKRRDFIVSWKMERVLRGQVFSILKTNTGSFENKSNSSVYVFVFSLKTKQIKFMEKVGIWVLK